MSLRPDDRSSRSRSKSATRDRSRSRSNVRAPKAPSPPSKDTRGYPSAPSPPKRETYGYAAAPSPPAPSGVSGSYGNIVTSPTHEVRSPTYELRSPTSAGAERPSYFGQTSAAPRAYPKSKSSIPYPGDDDGFTMGDYKDFPPHERPGYVGPMPAFPPDPEDALAYGAVTSPKSPGGSRHASYSNPYPSGTPQQSYPPLPSESPMSPSYQYTPDPSGHNSRSNSYTYQYAQPPDKITYTRTPQTGTHSAQYTQTSQNSYHEQPSRSYSQTQHDRGAQMPGVFPGSERPTTDRKLSGRLAVDTRNLGSDLNTPASAGVTSRMNRLSVSGNRPDLSIQTGGLPPPSPLLEAYHGTYQQISPMPLALRRDDDDDELDSLPPLSPAVSRVTTRGDKLSREAVQQREKRVQLYDPEEDAKTISKALGHRRIDFDAICDVLPNLTHDHIMELRKEYKKQVKVQGKGVNLSKHLKTKLTGNFGKVAYVTALGRWESEGYWANFWYQSHSSRRELLIESLMGRTNAEIWNIKDEFKDKRYSDNLVTCMEKELKMDKFRTAVLMVLEERRQEEQDMYPPEYRNRDVDTLHRALTAPKGGESTMLDIIVRRSDAHLREVIRAYEQTYHESFPRAALKKSNNLVGEVIAHILNGVINKPARDALLLHHAIKDVAEKNKDDELRYELLISRLVRLHWDKAHLEKVEREYYQRYQKRLEADIEDATRGEFTEYLVELCKV